MKLKTTLVLSLLSCLLFITNVTAQKNSIYGTPEFTTLPKLHDSEDYLSKTVILKVKDAYRQSCTTNMIDINEFKDYCNSIQLSKISKIYPKHQAPREKTNQWGAPLTDLSLIYELKYDANIPLQNVLSAFAMMGIFEYAEPHFIPKTSYTTSDPSYASQYHLAKIKADLAWDINKGNSSILIGIVDTGTEPTHPDLIGNMVAGYDVAMNDNDPTWQGNAHGVHVCGIAAATTDNSVGISGVGFNCKFMPIKIANASGDLIAAYEGITYAADNGCKVINCSWGGAGGGQYGQDIIDYATNNKDALVVCSAGNDGNENLSYPASYNLVLNVAATDNNDVKANFSSYGYNIKICAPGAGILSTWSAGGYINSSGTSMASPCVAGAAAIVRNAYPSYNAWQVAEQLMNTADAIDSLNSGLLADKLGSGRINLYKALTQNTAPAVTFINKQITDGNDGAIVAGDTIRIAGDFKNFLAPTTNLVATLSTVSTYVTLLDNSTSLGNIATLSVKNNVIDPFRIRVKTFTPLNTKVTFKITLTDGTYTSTEFFDVVVNVDYLNVNVNDVATSVTSKGMVGWNNDPPSIGLGFKYNGSNLLYDGGLIIGSSDSTVSDVLRGAPTKNTDFKSTTNIKRVTTNAISDFDTDGYFDDSPAKKPMNIKVRHQSYSWSSPGNNKYIMLKYTIVNKGTATINNLYAGIGADWDIIDAGGKDNRSSYDAANKMGYTFYTKANPYYAGIKVLSKNAPASHYAIDNITGGVGGLDISGGFTEAQKYQALSTSRADAGATGTGNDVIDIVKTGPFNVNAGDSIIVAFAILADDNLAGLQASAVNAQAKYDNILSTAATIKKQDNNIMQVYPNPTSNSANVEINLANTGKVDIRIYNMLGQEVTVIANETLSSGKHVFTVDVSKWNNGIYYCQVISEKTKNTTRLIVSK